MKYLFLSICLFFVSISNGQEYISATFLQSYDQEFFSTNYGVPASNGVELYRLLYTTTSINNEPDTASGLLVMPIRDGVAFPLVSYGHGTVDSRFDVPGYLSQEHVIPSIYGSMSTVTIAPDYLGLGYSKGTHPYVHADSEAWATYDMMVAARAWLKDEKDILTNEQVFITGYSQGGHAGMAFHRFMQTEKNEDVQGAVHMSGPYDISSGMQETLLSEEDYSIVAYTAAVALGMHAAYGNIFPNDDITQFFKQPYADIIISYQKEEAGLFEINSLLIAELLQETGRTSPKDMIIESVLNDILDNVDHPVNVALRDNDVYNWSPNSNTVLTYCDADEQVPFENAITAHAKMVENGSTTVFTNSINPDLTHGECVQPSVTFMVTYLFFNSSVTEITSTVELDIEEPSFAPNPSNGIIQISFDNRFQDARLELYNSSGQRIISKNITNQETITLSVNPGLYFVSLTNDGEIIGQQKLIIN